MNKRVRLQVTGRVQGVGFRPTVYRYAVSQGLAGFVQNTSGGVLIEVEGAGNAVSDFIEKIKSEPPRHARIENIDITEIPGTGVSHGFEISASRRSEDILAGMPPDLATCDECRAELFDPHNRRYRYPFINCTNCGPRFTIIRRLPYDREQTSMACFQQCGGCGREYSDPMDRRFDAQPNACHECGPEVKLITVGNDSFEGAPITEAVRQLKNGAILAVKGIGGYHICCDACNNNAVSLLRKRKNRPAKPLAVMFVSLDEIRHHCEINPDEESQLLSVSAPVVILRRKQDSGLSELISPDTNDIGAFLPYSPLHHLLLTEISPLVMTSGNLSEEPVIKDEDELTRIMPDIVESALAHNRPIVRRCDDSVLKIIQGQRLFIRRSRGFVPEPVNLPVKGPSVLACGAELKNTICVTRDNQAFISPHIGDLDNYQSHLFFRESIRDFTGLLEVKPSVIACDMHPDYHSTRYAYEMDIPMKIAVQHHHAHIAACMSEHMITNQVIGIALDGTGFGPDGTIWGGEILIADLKEFTRAAHFKQYKMPGGDEAVRHPSRMALSCLFSEFGTECGEIIDVILPAISEHESKILIRMMDNNINSPLTSSAGRLFDAVAAMIGMGQPISYEGQPAIRLQACADRNETDSYPFKIESGGELYIISFGPAIRSIISDMRHGTSRGRIAGMFHNTLARAIGDTCDTIRHKHHLTQVVLSGGVFQNDLLLEKVTNILHKRGFRVYSHHLAPPNDGGIALGQAAVALAKLQK